MVYGHTVTEFVHVVKIYIDTGNINLNIHIFIYISDLILTLLSKKPTNLTCSTGANEHVSALERDDNSVKKGSYVSSVSACVCVVLRCSCICDLLLWCHSAQFMTRGRRQPAETNSRLALKNRQECSASGTRGRVGSGMRYCCAM